jgi:3-hydroxyisobutyrate dehydrogenase
LTSTGSDGASRSPHGNGAAGRPRIAVIGLGTMGGAMAGSLLRAGLRVGVWDRTPAKADRLTVVGATAHPGPDVAAANADVVITMLPDGPAVTSVAVGDGMLKALRPRAIWSQMGTIGVQATEELAGTVARLRPDVQFVDAPVAGTRGPAEAGELLILASGPKAAQKPLQPVFDAIGSRTIWLEETGDGSRLKLVLNSWLAFLMEGIAESAALADTLGLDHAVLADALRGSPLEAPFALAKLAKIDAGDETPDFALRWATKDIDLALAEAGTTTLPVAAAISRRWHDLVDAGLGEADVSAARHGLGQPHYASIG